jgi:hypothetical protein
MDRHCASRIVRRVARRAGVNNPIFDGLLLA